ncbi:MAG TPA: class I SAM-dependent methyltransferase [Longimicrobium sp.]|jgi:predicted O-methyltransferase YrrM|nr:class I SAM-dependent methyltransferase [Longimicrobium sp.]
MKSLVLDLLPRPLAAAFRAYRTLRRSQAADRRLRRDHAVELTPRQIRDLRVLPGRAELLALLPRGGVVAEVGVAFGEFSRQIVDACAPRTLYLVDFWDPADPRYGPPALEATRERMREEIDAGTVQLVRGLSWDGLASLPEASLDWIYLDAAHDFESVKRDLDAALPRLRSGGIIAGHDYTRWSSQGIHRFGVVEAVNAFCAREGWELLYLTNESDRHISFAIRKLPADP